MREQYTVRLRKECNEPEDENMQLVDGESTEAPTPLSGSQPGVVWGVRVGKKIGALAP